MLSKLHGHLGLIHVCALCILFGLLRAAPAQQTSGEKLVKCDDPAQITDAVMVTNISVDGKTVNCGLFVKLPNIAQPVAPFQAGDDWLRKMTISLFNRTQRTIVAGAIDLQFLDTGDCRALPCAAEEIHLGQLPTVDAYDGRTGKPLKLEHPGEPPLDWVPGQTLTVHVGDYMDEIQRNLQNYMPVTAVSKVAVHIGPFFFRNGMRWVGPAILFPILSIRGNSNLFPIAISQEDGKIIGLPDTTGEVHVIGNNSSMHNLAVPASSSTSMNSVTSGCYAVREVATVPSSGADELLGLVRLIQGRAHDADPGDKVAKSTDYQRQLQS